MRQLRPRICVVGDLLADADVHGEAQRLSPEAPVPVVDEKNVVHRAGGAGLAATMAVRGGASVTLVAAVADDEAGSRLRSLLAAEWVGICALPWDGTTIEKVRIGAAGVPMLRLDRGEGRIPADLPPLAVRRATEAITGADAVLVADYGRGVAAHPVVRDALVAARQSGVPVVWDPHRRGPDPVPQTTLVCPNDAEARDYETAVPGGDLPAMVERAHRLRRQWDAGAVAITLGREGAVVVLGDGAPLRVPVLEPAEATDTCGAGDAFAAAAALTLGAGGVVSEAVQAAVAAAARFVGDGGAAGMSAARTAPTAPRRSRRQPAGPGTLVATGGCFDILHPGHVHTLRAARCLGDRLVVLVNDDDSVRRLKGPDRPLQPVEDRCAVLRSLADVDDVIVFGEDTPVEALRELRPDVFVKGGDYTAAEIPETAVLAEWGGSVVTVPFLDGRSTTELVSRARAR
jgi:D-beta-D-heptose 7-phosphate kinase/D-beta-D-heptose 1-phosphate adenosyltransferase